MPSSILIMNKSSVGSRAFEDHKDRSSVPIEQSSRESQFSSYELEHVAQENNETHPENNALWRSLFAFTTLQHAGLAAAAVVASIFTGLIRPISAIIFGKIFNCFTDYGAGTVDLKETTDTISTWCIALTALGAGTWIVEWAFFYLWILFGELQAKSVRQQMFLGLLHKNMEWYDRREDGIGSLLIRIETQIRELQLAVSQPLGILVMEICAVLFSIGTALFFSWKLTLVILATFPIVAGILAIATRGVGPAIEQQKRELSKASKSVNSAVTAINTVKAFNGEDQEVGQYLSTANAITHYYMIQARASAFQYGIIKFAAVGIFVSGFWFGLYLVTRGARVGHVLTTFIACGYAMQAVEIVLPNFLVLAKGKAAGETLKSIMAEMENGESTKVEDGDLRPQAYFGDIEVNNNVLKNATFFFPAGETTFLVGKSGSGKSTLGNLLMKYYKPQSGEIIVNGQPIQNLKTNWLRQNVTLVQQQSVLFNETILQNIAFGTREDVTTADICKAANSACLDQTIEEMPKGFDTLIGPKYRALSGGQTQRVAIARARLRDAPILILDESTSALDQTTRLEVMNRIREWRKGKTTIIVTHDVSQILNHNYVYVLQNAEVVEEGYRKNLVEKAHGALAQFLSVAGRENLSSAQPMAAADPDFAIISDTDEPHGNTSRWQHMSGRFFLHDNSLNHSPRPYPAKPRISLGSGLATVAQANALRDNTFWSSPVIPESLESSRPQRYSTLMPFMSPRPSPQVPSPAFHSSIDKQHLQGTSDIRTQFSPGQRLSLWTKNKSAKELDKFLEASSRRADHKYAELQGSIDRKSASLATIFASVLPALSWKDRLFLMLGLLCAALVGAATPVFSWVFSQLLETYYVVENRNEMARQWALCMLALAAIDGSALCCSHYFLERSGQAWITSLRVESLRRILAQPKSWFDLEQNSPSRLTECLDRNAEEMRNIMGRFVGLAITIFTMIGISIVWALVVDWKLALVAFSSAPVMYAVTRVSHWSSGRMEAQSNQACEAASSIFTETFSNIRVVRALTLENYFDRRHRNAITGAYRVGKTRAAVSGCMFGLTSSLMYYAIALAYYYGAVLISTGESTILRIFIVANLLLLGSGNAIAMLAMIPQLNSSRTTATQVLHLTNLPLNESHEAQGTKRIADPFLIKFTNLSFTYQARTHIKTLSNISLTISPGSCTAIVGPSGSGKSTIAALLLGLYPPDPLPGLYPPPTLTFAGKSVLDCNIYNLRSHMSIVAQTPILFPTTVFANITYGLAKTSPFNNYLAAERAAIDAGIHAFISSLENGYNTLIGEGGMGISGGQAQRIAIARALVRRPKVLILDEATSALDNESADGIREMVKRLRGKVGMAVVIISHNIDMMRIADTVVMVEDGRVVEKGSFEELRARRGAFESLITGDGRQFVVSEEKAHVGLGLGVEERFMTPVRPSRKGYWAL